MKKLLLALAVILGLLLSLSLASCARTVSIELPFEPADLDKVEMFRFQNPAEAEKKVITDPADVKDLCGLLESISLKDKKTEPVAGGSVTSFRFHCTDFRFHCTDGTTYEVIYSAIGVKSGRIKMTGWETDYFTSADLGACWNNYDYPVTNAAESELPALY